MSRADHATPNGQMLYLAGPMTGYEEHNLPAAQDAAELLRTAGFVVISPWEMDLIDGIDLNAEHGEDGWVDALERDLVVVGKVDGLALLDGWEASRGARLEVAAARGMGKPAQPLLQWLGILARVPGRMLG